MLRPDHTSWPYVTCEMQTNRLVYWKAVWSQAKLDQRFKINRCDIWHKYIENGIRNCFCQSLLIDKNL